MIRAREAERGFALISVLWAISILSLIAASILSTASLSYMMERNSLRRAEAAHIADFAIDRAILALLDARPDQRWRVDGVPRLLTLFGTRVELVVQDQLGLIDLNQADTSLLTRLFQSAGLPLAEDGS